MPRRDRAMGGHASAISFTRLRGAPSQSPTLKGTVTYRPKQITREPIEDAHSDELFYIEKLVHGHIKMTFIASDLSWLAGVVGADLQVVYTNGVILTAVGVVLIGDPVEIEQTAGTSNELTFSYASASLT